MTLLEFLDRWDERRLRRPERPLRDIRQFIGFAFLGGYYVMVWRFIQHPIPQANADLIRDAMLTLGPPVGLIVGAMFRSDARDEQATRNTGIALEAARTGAKAALASSGAEDPPKPDLELEPGETATVAAEPEKEQ